MNEIPQENGADGSRGLERFAPEVDWSVRDLIGLLRRNWLLIVACVVIALGVVWWRQQNVVPQYQAAVLLQRETESTGLEGLGLISRGRNDQDFASQLRLIKSRRVLGPAVDASGQQLLIGPRDVQRSGVAAEVRVAPDAAPRRFSLRQAGNEIELLDEGGAPIAVASPGETLSGPGFALRLAEGVTLPEPIPVRILPMETAIDRLGRPLNVNQLTGTNLVRLTYRDPDPNVAAEVVNAVAASYQEYSAELARDNAVRRREFLSDQLAAMSDSLAAEQGRLQDLQSRIGLIDPNIDAQAMTNQLMAAQTQLRELRFQEGVLESAVAAMDAGADPSEPLQRAMAMQAPMVASAQSLFTRLQELRNQRQGLTASRFGFTENQPEVDRLDSLIVNTQEDMREAAAQSLELLREREAAVQERIAELRGEVEALPAQMGPYARQQQRVAAVQDLFNMVANRYYEAQMAAAVETGNIEIVDPATVPRYPLPSTEQFGYLLALLVGLGVGGGLAFVRQQLDTKLRSPEDVRRASGLEILAMVPKIDMGGNGVVRPIPILTGATDPGAESFRSLRTMLRFATAERPKVIGITSPAPASGKSTVSVNLAAAMAQQGERVLLIDADLRRPMQHEIFSTKDKTPGLTDVLVGEVSVKDAIRDMRDFKSEDSSAWAQRLWLLTSGSQTPNPAELLGSTAFDDFLKRARREFDAVVIDTAPVLAVTDATVAGTFMDGMIVVAGADETERPALKESIRQLRQARVTLLGAVLNKVPESNQYYGYRRSKYYKYYRTTDGEKKRKKAGKGSRKGS